MSWNDVSLDAYERHVIDVLTREKSKETYALSKETYTCEKRPTKETNTCERRPEEM